MEIWMKIFGGFILGIFLISGGVWAQGVDVMELARDPGKLDVMEKEELPELQRRYEVQMKKAKAMLQRIPDTWEEIKDYDPEDEEK